MSETGSLFLLLIILFFLSAFFSSSETALLSVNRIKIEKLARKGDKRAKLVLKLLENPTKLITTILIGNNLVNIAAASISTSLAIKLFGDLGVGIATGIVTLITIIFGEVIPKNFAIRFSEKLALIQAPILYYLEIIFSPISYFLIKLTTFLFGKENKEKLTEEEIRLIIEYGEKEGALKKEEVELISNILKLDEIKVKELMTPRTKIVAVEENTPIEEVLEVIKKYSFSKIPVYKNNLDNITGIIVLKDVLKNIGKNIRSKELKREVHFVPETKNLADLLKEMKEKKFKLAIVIDEFGGVAGLITLEDILDYLVGKISDKKSSIVKVNSKIFIVNGDTPLVELEKELKEKISVEEDINTVAGLLMHKLQRVPKKGDKIKINKAVFEVMDTENNKITRVRVVKTT